MHWITAYREKMQIDRQRFARRTGCSERLIFMLEQGQVTHPIRRSIERMIGFAVLLIADWKERRRCAEKEDNAIWWQ